MKKLLNPRGYLSHTQISMWQQSPEKYKAHYFFGAPDITNKAMDFGSKVASAIESGEETDDEAINMLVALLPQYRALEHEMRVEFETSAGSVTLLGKLDTFCPDTTAFIEYKTGRVKWTQDKANKHKQLKQYASMIWLEHKKLPPTIHLVWAQTMKARDGSITLTGNIKTFEVKLTLVDILSYLAEVAKVAREIDEAYRAELNKLS